ncbi:MAG: trypsin-like peptidase domain-containing protein [FCB group bacterium]|nr:trypsin-like peptidase domain-containing protein [FCB group bacterium]
MGTFKTILISILLTVFATTIEIAGQNDLDTDHFPDMVKKVRKSLAIVKVGTNLEGIAKFGTAFILTSRGNTTFLASTYHTFFDSSEYRRTVLDSFSILIPDTSLIEIKFDVAESFRPAHVVTTLEDRDIAIITSYVPVDSIKVLNLKSLQLGDVEIIVEGVAVAATGYNLTQRTNDFNRLQYWPTTYKGIISSVRSIGPNVERQYIDRFQVDMLLNKGASGSPIYRVSDGLVVGMFNKFAHSPKDDSAPLGLAFCVPAWAISNCVIDYFDRTEIPDTLEVIDPEQERED